MLRLGAHAGSAGIAYFWLTTTAGESRQINARAHPPLPLTKKNAISTQPAVR
jgi:hypothetical protein